jgi:hypothetical protein
MRLFINGFSNHGPNALNGTSSSAQHRTRKYLTHTLIYRVSPTGRGADPATPTDALLSQVPPESLDCPAWSGSAPFWMKLQGP